MYCKCLYLKDIIEIGIGVIDKYRTNGWMLF